MKYRIFLIRQVNKFAQWYFVNILVQESIRATIFLSFFLLFSSAFPDFGLVQLVDYFSAVFGQSLQFRTVLGIIGES